MQQGNLTKPFYAVWVGQLISNLGSGISAFALGVYVFHITGSAAYYSWVLLAAFVPSLLLKPVGGVFADRYDRRIMMIIGDFGSAVSMVFIIIMLSLSPHTLWPIYVGSFLSSICIAFQNPALKATITDLLDEQAFSKGSGLIQLSESSKYIISPIIAGFLMQYYQINTVLMIDAITFLLAVMTVLVIKSQVITHCKSVENTNVMQDMYIGWQETIANKAVLLLLIIISAVSFFVGLLQSLLGPLILGFSTAKVLGITTTVAASGMLISSLVIGVSSKSTKKIKLLSYGLFIAGIFFAGMGLHANVWIIGGCGFLFFLTLPVINTSLDVLVRRNINNEFQGRVWAFVSLISQFGMGIAFLCAGWLADQPMYALLNHITWLKRIFGSQLYNAIGLLFIISGIGISLIGLLIYHLKILRSLDKH